MAHVRIALTAVLALALAGCAATPSRQLDYPPGAFYTPGGKPKVLPCMAGGLLCSPFSASRIASGVSQTLV